MCILQKDEKAWLCVVQPLPIGRPKERSLTYIEYLLGSSTLHPAPGSVALHLYSYTHALLAVLLEMIYSII
jgi:hypothetical protein